MIVWQVALYYSIPVDSVPFRYIIMRLPVSFITCIWMSAVVPSAPIVGHLFLLFMKAISRSMRLRGPTAVIPCKIFLSFNAKLLVFHTQFLVLSAKFIIFTHNVLEVLLV